jgi:hypothetical protein
MSLSTLEKTNHQENNIQNHKKILNIINKNEYSINKSIEKYLDKMYLDSIFNMIKDLDFYSLIYIEKYLLNKIEEYKSEYFYNNYGIKLLEESIKNIFYSYKKVSQKSNEGIVYKCLLNDTDEDGAEITEPENVNFNIVYLKSANENTDENHNLIHEFLVGKILNNVRHKYPTLSTFCYTYGGFFCSNIKDSFEDLCKIQDNSFPLTTFILLENAGDISLSDIICKIEAYEFLNIYKLIFLTLLILQEEHCFVHNDLHLGNILLTEYKYSKNIKIVYNNYEYNIPKQ